MTTFHTKSASFAREDDTTPGTYNVVGEVVSIGGPDGTASIIDVTNLSDSWVTKLVGLPDGGNVALGLNLDSSDTEQGLLWSDYTSQNRKSFRISVPTTPAVTITFNGYVTQWAPDLAQNAKADLSVTVIVDGVPTFA